MTSVTYPAAELDRRFYAFVLDRLLAWGIYAAAGYLAWRFLIDDDRLGLGVGVIVGTVLLVSLVYAVLLGVAGVSPGKALVGLRVVAYDDGRPIGVPLALLRVAVLGFFTLPTAGLGLATLAWTAVMDPGGRRRGGHDRMTNAVVVDVRPVPAIDAEADARPRQIVNLTALRLMPTPAPTTPAPTPTPMSAPETPARPASPLPSRPPSGPPPSRPPAGAPPAGPPGPAPVTPAPTPTPAAAPTPAPTSAPVPVPGVAAAPAPNAAPSSTSRPGGWKVSFDTGEEFVVEGLALVGRRPEPRGDEPVRHVVPLKSSDMSVSKTHAQFQVVPDGALVVMDRGSTNGSVLVRQGVSRPLTAGRPATLVDGDTVKFGDRTMTVSKDTHE